MLAKEVQIQNVSTKDTTYEKDLHEIIQINDEIWKKLKNKDLYYIEGTDEEFINNVLVNNGLLLKVLDIRTSKIVGFLIVKRKIDKNSEIMQTFFNDNVEEYIEMDTVGVLASHRGMHLQQRLILEAEKIMLDRKDKMIKYSIATVHPNNIASLKSLLYIGYEIIEERIMYNNKRRYIVKKELFTKL